MKLTSGTSKAHLARGKGVYALLLSTIVALITLSVTANSFGQAILNPNQIKGVIEFTNTNPTILEILSLTGKDEGFKYAYVWANSIGVSPTLNNYSYPFAETGTSIGYELTVESSEEGIPYSVNVYTYLDDRSDVYRFSPSNSAPVFPEPSADVSLDFRQCAGLLDIQFVGADGAPISVEGGRIYAMRETAPGSDRFSFQAYDFAIPNGSQQEYLAVHGDGSLYRVDVYLDTGTDPYSDQVRSLAREFVKVECDQIVKLVIPASLLENLLGEITGRVDMEGEDELRISDLTRMHAFSGPLLNFRYDTLMDSPSQGNFTLENLVPSEAESPPRPYWLIGDMAFRTGYRTEYFRTPYLRSIYVGAGETVDLQDTFVMDPGYVNGGILLAGPPDRGTGSCLADLYRDADRDYDQNGIPDEVWISSSHVGASGSTNLALSATMSSWGGVARVGFEGGYNAATGNFEGDYEIALGGLKREPSIWRPDDLTLHFRNYTTDTYPYSQLQIINKNIGEREIVPGEALRIDHAYCLSETRLSFRSLSGTIYQPQVQAWGTFDGTDFQGDSANYSTQLREASGTPTSLSSASSEGQVTMCLPEGVYTMTPRVTAVNPGGGTSYTELPPVTVKVGCEQVIELTPELQISLNDLPKETSAPILRMSGSVSSANEVAEMSVLLNQGDPQVICRKCGKDPEFSFETALEEGNNEIALSALDNVGNTASVKTSVRFTPAVIIDDPAPVVEDDPIVSTFGKVTGGGFILDETNRKHTFGFNVHYNDKGHATMKGQLQFVSHDGKMKFHGNELISLAVDNNKAVFSGTGRLNGKEGYVYWVEVLDNGNPGRGKDTFSIKIFEHGSTAVEYGMSGTLTGGNIKVHSVKPKVKKIKNGKRVLKKKSRGKKRTRRKK